jgi:hypothetical protein
VGTLVWACMFLHAHVCLTARGRLRAEEQRMWEVTGRRRLG